MDEVVKHKGIWVIVLLCPIVFFFLQYNVKVDMEHMIYTNTDQEMTRKVLRKVFYQEGKAANPQQVEEIHHPSFVDIYAFETAGYLFMLEEATPIIASESGLVVYTGDNKYLGKTISVYYQDGITVTYGFLDSYSLLPYSSFEKGHTLGMKEPGQLYIRVEKGTKVYNLEETLNWFNGQLSSE